MTDKKRKKKVLKVSVNKKCRSFRIIVKGKPRFGINGHGMYEHSKTVHVHIGESRKLVLYPKDLIGYWRKKGKKYVRVFPKDAKKRKRRRRKGRRSGRGR